MKTLRLLAAMKRIGKSRSMKILQCLAGMKRIGKSQPLKEYSRALMYGDPRPCLSLKLHCEIRFLEKMLQTLCQGPSDKCCWLMWTMDGPSASCYIWAPGRGWLLPLGFRLRGQVVHRSCRQKKQVRAICQVLVQSIRPLAVDLLEATMSFLKGCSGAGGSHRRLLHSIGQKWIMARAQTRLSSDVDWLK
jgi:hypothetical protein